VNLFDVVIVQPILNLLMAIYAIVPGGDFGVSVVIFTIVLRFALWPLAKKQLHQAKAMRKMQPELKKIKEKYKNNSQAQGLAMMDLYKKHNISPFGSIGILLIQLPILIAIYRVVQIFALYREDLAKYTYGFMENIPAVKELIADPTHFNQNFLGFIDLTQHGISSDGVVIGLVILSLLAAVMQYLLSKQMSPSTDNGKRLRDILAEAGQGKEADQAELNAIVMRKMTKVMPVFLFFVMVSLPGALALYMATGNIVAYFQNASILKKDEQEMEALSAETTQKGKKSAKQRAKNATEAKITKITAKDK
jgi:YidC/Oxa1 family membrane protein insertase